jgi:P4 family phage/plasmid primase-like protien
MSTGDVFSQSPTVVNGLTPYSAALWYYKRGLHPVPWYSRGGKKILAFSKDDHFDYASYTSDPSLMERVLDEWAFRGDWQVGLALNENGGVFAVDVDSRDQMAAWEAEHGPIQGDTWTQTTGRDGGGEHRLFRLEGRGAVWPKQGSFDRSHPNLEFRSNGFIGVSPSIHPSGRRYQWTSDSPVEIAGTDWDLAAMISARSVRKDRSISSGSTRAAIQADGTSAYTSDVDEMLLTGVPVGMSQHAALRDLVWDMVSRGMSDVMIKVMWDTVVSRTRLTRPDQPWTEAHFASHLSSAREKLGGGIDPELMKWAVQVHNEPVPEPVQPRVSTTPEAPSPEVVDKPGKTGEADPLRPITYAELKGYGAHQAGMGELFADRFHKVFKWSNDENAYYTWFSYDGKPITHWRRETYNAMAPQFMHLVQKLGKIIWECVKDYLMDLDEGTADGKERAKAARAYLLPFQKSDSIRGITKIIAADPRLAASPTDFTPKPNILNFANGTFDVKTGKLYPHRREDMNTALINRELDLSLAEKDLSIGAPLFDGMLWRMCADEGEVDPGTHALRVQAVQRWLGYQLHGSNPEKRLAVFEGATCIGKNQVVEAVGELLADYAYTSCPPSLLVRSRQDRHSSVEASLSGKRLVIVNELTKGQVLDEGQVLRLVNPEGARVDLRKMRENAVSTEITWKLTVTTNAMPRTDTTDQVLERLAFFPLSKIPVPKEDRDPGLKAAILAAESDVILAHVVTWWREWWTAHESGNHNALALPDESAATLAEFVEDNLTPLHEFVEEMCVIEQGAFTDAREIWRRAVGYWEDQHKDKRLEYSGGRKELYKILDGTKGVTRRTRGNRKDLIGFENIRVRPLYGEADKALQSWAEGVGR